MKTFATHNFSLIQTACEAAHQEQKLIAVCGHEPGLGMSTALQFYQENGPHIGAVYLKISPNENLREHLGRIVLQVAPGFEMLPKSESELEALIIYGLKNSGFKRVILIDDFIYNAPLIHSLRHITSKFAEGLGVVFGMNDRTLGSLRRNRERPGVHQLYAKITASGLYHLQRPRRDEIAAIAKEAGITDPATITDLVLNFRDYGSLNQCITHLKHLTHAI